MSYLSFHSAASPSAPAVPKAGSVRSAYSAWLMANHGAHYRATIEQQRQRPGARQLQAAFTSATPAKAGDQLLVGIVGGGFAGQ